MFTSLLTARKTSPCSMRTQGKAGSMPVGGQRKTGAGTIRKTGSGVIRIWR